MSPDESDFSSCWPAEHAPPGALLCPTTGSCSTPGHPIEGVPVCATAPAPGPARSTAGVSAEPMGLTLAAVTLAVLLVMSSTRRHKDQPSCP